TKQAVHGDHKRVCSDITLLRPNTNIDHMKLIDVKFQNAAAELDGLAMMSKDMEIITQNHISFDDEQENHKDVMRARELRKGVLTAPFELIKTNRLGVILYFRLLLRYLGGVFDIE
ncbi:hypothetical protein Tco_0617455, partial [Tanacetum coccineum]